MSYIRLPECKSYGERGASHPGRAAEGACGGGVRAEGPILLFPSKETAPPQAATVSLISQKMKGVAFQRVSVQSPHVHRVSDDPGSSHASPFLPQMTFEVNSIKSLFFVSE